jgi:hypothetical protein|tara:strand:- start:198 stop:698 length:501 start_codon:yes stop_codon:yes gene_type:complete
VSQYAFGHALQIVRDGAADFRYQNFFIGQKLRNHLGADDTRADFSFLAFGFSGVTLNRTGDGMEASLVFPNNEISRAWGVEAIEKRFRMLVQVLVIDDPNHDTGPTQTHNVVHTYTGIVTGGQWDNVSLNIELTSILDAVGTDVPNRSLTQRLVGNLPISNGVRLQ